MPKATVVSTLINNHSVFHVISGVSNDCHHRIHTTRTLLEIIFTEGFSSDDGRLREQESVDLVVHSEGVVVVWSSHGLLSHLALVHITWTLVVVSERYG